MKMLLIALVLVFLCAASALADNKKYPPREIVQFVTQFPALMGECTVESMKLVDAPCIIHIDVVREVAYCALLDSDRIAYAIVVKKDGMDDYVLWKRGEQGV